MVRNLKHIAKLCCIILIIINIALLGLDIYEMLYIRLITLKYIVFCSLTFITIYFLVEKEYELFLSLFSFAILHNPFLPVYLPLLIFKAFEFITIILFIYCLYFIFYTNRSKQIEKIAYALDEYLKELDHTLSGLSYHQITIYIHNRFPNAKVSSKFIQWKIESLPEALFIIQHDDYTHGQNHKGQVKVDFLNQFNSIEVYLNFNFSESVRFSVKLDKSKEGMPSYSARSLRYILIKRYHYIDL